jgi:hypothetical protein
MSEEDKLDIVAAILASGISRESEYPLRGSARRVVAYRAIKGMLVDHGTEPLSLKSGDEFARMTDRLLKGEPAEGPAS